MPGHNKEIPVITIAHLSRMANLAGPNERTDFYFLQYNIDGSSTTNSLEPAPFQELKVQLMGLMK